jgi:acetate kinase
MNDAVLVINAGSSSIKFAVFVLGTEKALNLHLHGVVDGIGEDANFSTNDAESGQGTIKHEPLLAADHAQALQYILDWLEQKGSDLQFVAAGHRVVHGGDAYSRAVRVDDKVLAQFQDLVRLAPLHQPHALQAIQALMVQRPHMPQVACFDTAFHANMPLREQRFALPSFLLQEGVRRYGFHGLSYEYIAGVMPAHLGEAANGRVVIAHLGHGVSMCAVKAGQSMATTMSFTPLDGLPMGTRSGAIDPAIVLYLLERGMTSHEISDLLHHQSGLLGLSGISDDMRTLLASPHPQAAEAVDYFCYRVSRELGSLAAALGGLDVVIFTGGIGEHASLVREKVCNLSAWLGLEIDAQANRKNALRISVDASKVSVWVIPTDEEQVIARHTAALI